jgi:hypothetical protein
MEYPNPVGDEEHIARYLLEKSKFSAENARVKHNAFMPKNDVISAFRVEGMAHAAAVELGYQYVAAPQGRVVLAYAKLRCLHFREQELIVTPTELPHPRHVDIHGWGESTRSRVCAQILAEQSELCLA